MALFDAAFGQPALDLDAAMQPVPAAVMACR